MLAERSFVMCDPQALDGLDRVIGFIETNSFPTTSPESVVGGDRESVVLIQAGLFLKEFK
jgi:hypothetical protein